jgi:XisI protein
MDSLKTQYQLIIESVLTEYANFIGASEPEIQQELIFDRDRDHYLLVETGWQRGRRIYGPFIHIDIIDRKIWIQHDGTEEGIAYELVTAGIPKDQIVLAYKSIDRRQVTEFAVS